MLKVLSKVFSPHRRWLILVSGLATVLMAAVLGYQLGLYEGQDVHPTVLLELEDLRDRRKQSERVIAEMSQQVVHLKQGARIDRDAAEQVRVSVVKSENEIAALREEIAFYRGLMTPAVGEKGLGIRSLNIYPAGEAGRYQFELVVQQLAVKHRLLKGELRLAVSGLVDDASTVLTLGQLSEPGAADFLKFKFKYFEKLQGELLLPEGFEPSTVDITVRTWGRPTVKLVKQFPWVIGGA